MEYGRGSSIKKFVAHWCGISFVYIYKEYPHFFFFVYMCMYIKFEDYEQGEKFQTRRCRFIVTLVAIPIRVFPRLSYSSNTKIKKSEKDVLLSTITRFTIT